MSQFSGSYSYSTTGGPTFALANVSVDGLGRLRAGTETLTLVGGGTRQHASSFTYDMRSQLRTGSVSNINNSTWLAGYTYDKAGNVTQQTVGGANTDFDYNGDLMTNKVIGLDNYVLGWDNDGRMTSGINRSLTYNWDSKLRSATSGGTTVNLRYDPDGNRVLRTVNTTTSRKYVVDTEGELPTILLEIDPAVQDPNDAITKTYIYANSQIIAQHDGFYGDPMYFYLHDRLGSVRELIDTSGAVVNSYTYEPFGQSFASEVTQTVANPWQFTGQYFDSEFSQYYLRARQYDPAIYRFTARDPHRASFQNPLELHRYLYCRNDSSNSYDPSGKFNSDGLVLKVSEAGAFRRIIVNVAIQAVGNGMEFERSMDILSRAADLIPSGSDAILNRHHAWPKYLGGAINGFILTVPPDVHIEFHKLLSSRLEAAFGHRFEKNFYHWSADKEWTELMENPEDRLQMFKILSETSFEMDALHGTNMTFKLFMQTYMQTESGL